MNNEKNVYCQLKYACNLKLSENSFLIKQRKKCSIQGYGDDFYVEEYYDFESLINRIKADYLDTVRGYKNQGINILSDECSFPDFFVFNRFGEYYRVAMSSYGWRISISIFIYINEYFSDKYGKDNIFDKIEQRTENNQVFFYWNYKREPLIFPARELVSEETARIILKEFLDTGKTEDKLDSEIFRREILSRNY